MFSWSVKKRLIYLGLVIAFLLLITSGFWYGTRPGPTCFDNKQNQGELAVDCGGPCARVCPFEVKPLQVVWSRIFPIGAGRYDVATFIRNPNRHHAARQLMYRLRLFDQNGVLVTTRDNEAFLNPGESTFLYNARLEAGSRAPERVLFEITDGPIWQRVDRELPAVKVVYKSFANQPAPFLSAEVENTSLQNLNDVQILAVLSDENENALAVSSTLVEQLARGEKREVVFTWPASFPVEPTFFDFYPHFDLVRVQ